nr:hypothetical protein [Tanacetum cinerariifolium]
MASDRYMWMVSSPNGTCYLAHKDTGKIKWLAETNNQFIYIALVINRRLYDWYNRSSSAACVRNHWDFLDLLCEIRVSQIGDLGKSSEIWGFLDNSNRLRVRSLFFQTGYHFFGLMFLKENDLAKKETRLMPVELITKGD